MKKARLNDVRGEGRTSRSVFLGRDAHHAIADYLEAERPGDAGEQSEALFLAACTIAARRPGGRLPPRSVNTIVGEIGRIHDAETTDRDRHLRVLRPHDLSHTFGLPVRKPAATTALSWNDASGTPTTGTCASTPTHPTTSPPATSKTSDLFYVPWS